MMVDSPETWTQFFGWYTAFNVGIYLISAVAVLTMRNLVVRRGERWFGVSADIALRPLDALACVEADGGMSLHGEAGRE